MKELNLHLVAHEIAHQFDDKGTIILSYGEDGQIRIGSWNLTSKETISILSRAMLSALPDEENPRMYDA